MAVDLGKLIAGVKKGISFEELSGKRIAIDAYNTIYQFLSIIRQQDGTPLTDANGRVTSHLSGLFYRTSSLVEYGIKPVYVFDGIPPALKRRTLEARMNRREHALEAWSKAKEEGLIEEARMHAVASTRINKEIVEGAKTLLGHMGIPYIQAPGEGEAQAAWLVRKGLVYGLTSQDYDSFLFGADVVIRNFAISGKRKLPKKNVYVDVSLERIYLSELLGSLGIDQRQLILLGMLVGTDFNGGIERVGPMTALKIVRENGSLEKVRQYVKERYNADFDADPEEVIGVFEKPEIKEFDADGFEALFGKGKVDREGLVEFMCKEHGFSPERIEKFVGKARQAERNEGQKSIGSWI